MTFDPVRRLAGLHALMQQGLVGLESYQAVVDSPNLEPQADQSKCDQRSSSVLKVRDLSFSTASGKTILQNLSVEMYVGELTLICGPSGVGKPLFWNYLPACASWSLGGNH